MRTLSRIRTKKNSYSLPNKPSKSVLFPMSNNTTVNTYSRVKKGKKYNKLKKAKWLRKLQKRLPQNKL